jgi:hypothetical protein
LLIVLHLQVEICLKRSHRKPLLIASMNRRTAAIHRILLLCFIVVAKRWEWKQELSYDSLSVASGKRRLEVKTG